MTPLDDGLRDILFGGSSDSDEKDGRDTRRNRSLAGFYPWKQDRG